MMGWYGDGMGGAGPLLWILMGAFWIAVIGLIVFLVIRLLAGSRQGGRPTATPGRAGQTPEQVLDRMFAAGEVDEQTYRGRRGALTQMRKPS